MLDSTFLKRIRRRERIAKWVIVSGGVIVIMSVLGILVQIASVALPLFYPPESDVIAELDLQAASPASQVAAIGIDEFLETGYLMRRDGSLRFYGLEDGEVREERRLTGAEGSESGIRSIHRHRAGEYSIVWEDGSFSRDRFSSEPEFLEGGERVIRHDHRRRLELPPFDSEPREIRSSVAELVEDGGFLRATLFTDGSLRLDLRVVVESFLKGPEERDFAFELTEDAPFRVEQFALSSVEGELYAVTDDNELLRWKWDLIDPDDPVEPELYDEVPGTVAGGDITALDFVFGDRSIVVGDDRGRITRWFPVRSRSGDGRRVLTRIHALPSIDARVVDLDPTERDKSVLSRDERGTVRLDHATSQRRLLRFATDPPLILAALNSRGDGLIGLDESGGLRAWRLDIPHPEVSLWTLFGKVWYEGYDRPKYEWQSSASTQDSEPKISLVPLIFGTAKGTFYAMMFAFPIAVLGALYTSQFLHPRLRALIKPMVEIMAAIPSVVIGFLAAQWFAPVLERNMGGMLLSFVMLPVGVMATFVLWDRLGFARLLRGLKEGYEFLFLVPTVLVAVLISVWIGRGVESILFEEDLQTFLFEGFGVVYDPRNSVVIAFALGFAVIPIIFTITEDSMSNVPRSLTAGSLALGASRWQTAWRVILPAATPGIFAATMIGLGRAIGETMIVLMATGNTAIMSLSPFNGMRTISANIATEAPEAPYLGSLYRVLFLSAVILFVSTFLLNTVAEVVRHHIRRKYSRF